MIILQVNKFFHEKGGSERYFFALSRAQEARGHEVVHFAMAHPRNLDSPWATHFAPRREYEGAGADAWRGGASFIRSRPAARCLEGLLRRVRPDVAHLHNIYHQLTPSVIDVLSRARVPVVMTLHDYKLACPAYSLFSGGRECRRCAGGAVQHAVRRRCGGSAARSWLLAIESGWQRVTRVYERVDRFIAPSTFLRGVMVAAGVRAERIHHVPPFAPDGIAGGGGTAPQGLPDRFVAYVGRLSPEKGIGVLLDAMERLPGIPLVVFGEGPDGDVLRARARDLSNVCFAGHVAPRDLAAAMPCAAAAVLPTLSPENAPLAVVEAAAAGVPVIVSDRGGLPEMAAAVGGVTVPAGDAFALAEAIARTWSEGDAARARAARAWERACELFGPARHLDAVERVYREAGAGGNA